MKTIKILAGIVTTGLVIAGCTKVLDDKQDLSKIPPAVVFSDSNIAKLYLDNIYETNLPGWGGATINGSLNGVNAELTDEGFLGTGSSNKYVQGSIQNTDVADFGTAVGASSAYGKIFTINTFLESLATAPIDASAKNVFKGQALFFRAYRYFDLVKIYGGVPLVLKSLPAVGDEAKQAALLPRNLTSECIKQIVADLDTAIKYLPGNYAVPSANWGRITAGAAAAFKGRVLLTYASPMFNPDDLEERWTAAYDANLQAKNILTANGYGLNASFENMWFSEINNPEAVMITGYNTNNADPYNKNNTWDNATRPSYLGTGGGSNQPSWEFTRVFDMKDGKSIDDPTSKYKYYDTLFYQNRDPRFDKTIAFNGCTWGINSNPNYKLWTYFYYNQNNVLTTSEPNGSASKSGFYTRKAVMPNGASTTAQYAGTDWMEIRYAEVLLNLAESAVGAKRIATGQEGYQGLVEVRKRAGIEIGDGYYGLAQNMDRNDLFKAILHERQIEFAFEGKRLWDLRRWKLVETTLNGKQRHKLVMTLKTGAGVPDFATFNSQPYRDAVNLDQAYSEYFNFDFTQSVDPYDYNWQSNYYFLPIPQAAINNNPNMQQNNDWGGSFDPLK